MPYYEVEMVQLLADKTKKFEVVFKCQNDELFTEDVVFFALCNLNEKPCIGEEIETTDYRGIILPVILEDGELLPQVTSNYLSPNSQEVLLRRKK